MSDEMGVPVYNNNNSSDHDQSYVVDIYPLCNYYFGSKDAIPFKDETLPDRLLRMKSKYFLNFSFILIGFVNIFNILL